MKIPNEYRARIDKSSNIRTVAASSLIFHSWGILHPRRIEIL